MKKILCLVFCMLFAFSMIFVGTGCKKEAAKTEEVVGETTAETTEEATVEKPTLKLVEFMMADTDDQEWLNMISGLYTKFEEENNCTLDITTYSWGDVHMQLQIMGEAGGLPDVANYWIANMGALFAAKEYTVPLDPFIEKEGEEFLQEFDTRLLVKYNDQVYGLPAATGNMGLYVNKTLLEEAGFTEAPKTWDEFREMCIAVTNEAEGIWGIALNGADSEAMLQISPFIAQNGGHVGYYNGEIAINSPETVEALQFVADLINVDKVVPGYVSSGYKEARDIFYAGKSAFLIDAAWSLHGILTKETDFEWYTTTLPEGKMAGTGISVGDSAASIFAGTKYPELSWELVKYLASYDYLEPICAGMLYWPTISEELNQKMIDDPETGYLIKPFNDQLELGNVLDVYGEMPIELEAALNLWKEEYHKAILGEKTVQDAMDTVAEGFAKLDEEFLAKYGAFEKESAGEMYK
jgi:multiple sugar transport system substrate-binding protein